MEPRNLRLDRYVLGLTGRARPRVGFLGTASGDSPAYAARFRRAMGRLDCEPTVIPLFRIDGRLGSPAEQVRRQDVIYVGGGNTANLLALWRLHGVDRALRDAWRRGVILCGVSAGMICWFEGGVTDSFGALRELNDGLGLLPGSACPHFDGEAQRRPTCLRLVRERVLPAGFAADDGAALHFVGRRLRRAVASRPRAQAFRVERCGREAVALPLPTPYLTADGRLPPVPVRR